MLLIPLKLLKSKRDSVRKAREAHLIQTAKAVEPLAGANFQLKQQAYYNDGRTQNKRREN